MACMKLGSKSEAFLRDGQTWVCTAGLPSDIVIEVGEMSFHLHKFPLLSRSGLLEKLIEDVSSGEDGQSCILQLHDIPGGAKTFELIAKFCYGVKIEVSALNVVSLRCAAEHLQMTEAYGDGNLIKQTEDFLDEVFGNWGDSIRALETCEEVLPHAEEVHVVSRCIDSIAVKACSDPSLFGWPVSNSAPKPEGAELWNGICTESKTRNVIEDWWYEDVSFLSLPLYKRLIVAVESKGMNPEGIAGSLMFYAKRYLPGLSFKENTNHHNSASTSLAPSEADQRVLLEEIVGLFPNKKEVILTNFLLRLLQTAMSLHASPSCRENLEKRIGAQLDHATLDDLLIPNMGYTVETLYDIDCVQRILDHFMSVDQAADEPPSPCIVEEEAEERQVVDGGSLPLTPVTMVAKLVDGYLAEVAPDVNLKLPKFQSLAAVIPEFARPLDDGIYRAIDIYLKAHPWLTDLEREQLCRLMNCQKLSLEACTHAAQNERLPLRVIVQVLFFEQLRLRTSIAGWFYVSNNTENSRGSLAITKNDIQTNLADNEKTMEMRVAELEKECLSMKQEIGKMGKSKSGWNICKKLGFKRSQPKTVDC
ncbi:BTB/POZ domain-containing protein At5g03250-like [Papaver somniferum]|uniref:BTB/POZ domain-containing protein At5g03250-like n=1 Tax=Papaver somniferum TaxID=3469 RepID=UPI000E6F6337|nr:BTB/POZ domain-containing protein At5g03250-like [Papaver somniferum]